MFVYCQKAVFLTSVCIGLCIDWMKFLNLFQAQYVFTQADDLLDSKPMVKLSSVSHSKAVKTAIVAIAESAAINRKEG